MPKQPSKRPAKSAAAKSSGGTLNSSEAQTKVQRCFTSANVVTSESFPFTIVRISAYFALDGMKTIERDVSLFIL